LENNFPEKNNLKKLLYKRLFFFNEKVEIFDTVDNSVAERSRSVDIMDTVDKATTATKATIALTATTASSIVNFLQIKI
jgi:hypothetical protein